MADYSLLRLYFKFSNKPCLIALLCYLCALSYYSVCLFVHLFYIYIVQMVVNRYQQIQDSRAKLKIKIYAIFERVSTEFSHLL